MPRCSTIATASSFLLQISMALPMSCRPHQEEKAEEIDSVGDDSQGDGRVLIGYYQRTVPIWLLDFFHVDKQYPITLSAGGIIYVNIKVDEYVEEMVIEEGYTNWLN